MAVQELVAGIDAGTTGIKVIIADTSGAIVASAYREYPCLFPQPGWVEQDVHEVWRCLCEASREVFGKHHVDPQTVKSLGFSSQRGTLVFVDREFRPLMHSVVYSDMRSEEEVAWIRSTIGAEAYQRICGLAPSTYWSYPKVKWLIDKAPRIYEKTWKILNGQEYFLHRLGATDLVADPASRTAEGFLDIATLDWSHDLLGRIGCDPDKLPKMGTPARQVGRISRQAAAETGFAEGMPIAIGAGDQQCAAVGAGIVREGMAEITIGTAMVMVAHIDRLRPDPRQQVTFGGSGLPGKWDMEGFLLTAGSALKWWRNTYAQEEQRAANALGLDVYDLITLEAAKSPLGARGHLFFPYFNGMLSPRVHDQARGGTLGLSHRHDRKDMARSVMEGVTMATGRIVAGMEEVLGRPFEILRLSGGGAKSEFWCRLQADVYGRPLERLRCSECTGLGAAILGATGCGIFASVAQGVERMVHPRDAIEPDAGNHRIYRELQGIFADAVNALIDGGIYERLTRFQARHG